MRGVELYSKDTVHIIQHLIDKLSLVFGHEFVILDSQFPGTNRLHICNYDIRTEIGLNKKM